MLPRFGGGFRPAGIGRERLRLPANVPRAAASASAGTITLRQRRGSCGTGHGRAFRDHRPTEHTVQVPGSAVAAWPAEAPLPVDPEWKRDYAASVRRRLRHGVDVPLFQRKLLLTIKRLLLSYMDLSNSRPLGRLALSTVFTRGLCQLSNLCNTTAVHRPQVLPLEPACEPMRRTPGPAPDPTN